MKKLKTYNCINLFLIYIFFFRMKVTQKICCIFVLFLKLLTSFLFITRIFLFLQIFLTISYEIKQGIERKILPIFFFIYFLDNIINSCETP